MLPATPPPPRDCESQQCADVRLFHCLELGEAAWFGSRVEAVFQGRETRLWKLHPVVIGVPKDSMMVTAQDWWRRWAQGSSALGSDAAGPSDGASADQGRCGQKQTLNTSVRRSER